MRCSRRPRPDCIPVSPHCCRSPGRNAVRDILWGDGSAGNVDTRPERCGRVHGIVDGLYKSALLERYSQPFRQFFQRFCRPHSDGEHHEVRVQHMNFGSLRVLDLQDQAWGEKAGRIFYLAVPPSIVEDIAAGLPSSPQNVLRGGIGMLEEVPNGWRQPGDAAMVFERRKADQLHESLRQLLLAVVEGDAMAVAKGRGECETLLEVIQENNPSDVIRDDLRFVRDGLQNPKQRNAAVALVKLQLDVEQLSQLLGDLLHPELRRRLPHDRIAAGRQRKARGQAVRR